MSPSMYLSNCAGVITIGVAPWRPQSCLTAGWLVTFVTAWFSLSTISRGVPLGAISPSQIVAS